MERKERELVLESYNDISYGKGRDCNEFFVELELRYSDKGKKLPEKLNLVYK